MSRARLRFTGREKNRGHGECAPGPQLQLYRAARTMVSSRIACEGGVRGSANIVRMKFATWNVNGIRAREAQLCEWVARDRPDVVCLQELKASPEQVPERCKLDEYHVFWHGLAGYSGVSLHIRKNLLAEPVFSHPEFDMETRIV